MLTSTLASSVTAWRGDPAIFLSITGGDVSLAHDRRRRGRFIVDKNTSEDSWHSNSQGLTAWAMDRGEGRRRIAQIQGWNGKQCHQTSLA